MFAVAIVNLISNNELVGRKKAIKKQLTGEGLRRRHVSSPSPAKVMEM